MCVFSIPCVKQLIFKIALDLIYFLPNKSNNKKNTTPSAPSSIETIFKTAVCEKQDSNQGKPTKNSPWTLLSAKCMVGKQKM